MANVPNDCISTTDAEVNLTAFDVNPYTKLVLLSIMF